MKSFVICIDWYGPHTRASFKTAALADGRYAGLYMALKRQPITANFVQYVGLSKSNLPHRVAEYHPSLNKIEEPEMWGGLLSYHNAPNHSGQGTSNLFGQAVDDAERIIIYFLQPPLNIDRRTSIPVMPTIIVNRWFDGETPNARRSAPDPAIPDFLEYDPEAGATLAWHGDTPRVQRMSVAEIQARGLAKP